MAQIVDVRMEDGKQSFMFSSEKSSMMKESADAMINISIWLYRKTKKCQSAIPKFLQGEKSYYPIDQI